MTTIGAAVQPTRLILNDNDVIYAQNYCTCQASNYNYQLTQRRTFTQKNK